MSEYRKALMPGAVTVAAVLVLWLTTGHLGRSDLVLSLVGLISTAAVYRIPNTPKENA